MKEEIAMNLYVNILASYEGESETPAPQFTSEGTSEMSPPPAPTAQPKPVGEAKSGSEMKHFTQEEVNKFLAEDRRKHQEKYTSLEASYQELLANQDVVGEQRKRLEKELEDLQARHRTKEQQIAYERKQEEEKAAQEIEQLRQDKLLWENRFTESTITQALQQAAIKHDAYNPSQIIVQLKGQTELVEAKDSTGKTTGELVPMVTMTVHNEETGVTEPLRMTPDEAVEYMQKNTKQWGNLFKNNIREGIGAGNATDGANIGPNGMQDHGAHLSDDQWFELRKKNPAALGLGQR